MRKNITDFYVYKGVFVAVLHVLSPFWILGELIQLNSTFCYLNV